MLDRAVTQLRNLYESDGKAQLFDVLKGTISAGGAMRPLAQIAAELGISGGAAKVAAHRLRHRYREILTQVIAETVESKEEVEDEIRHLLSVFSED